MCVCVCVCVGRGGLCSNQSKIQKKKNHTKKYKITLLLSVSTLFILRGLTALNTKFELI